MATLYYSPLSPESRACLLVLKAIGLELELHTINKMAGEHTTAEFTRLSPYQMVPVLKDGDFILSESRAINGYLASEFSDKSSLYPKDVQERAIVNKLLFFDMGTLLQKFHDYTRPIMNGETNKPDLDLLKSILDALTLLNMQLEGHKFAAGNEITIADHSLVATVSTMKEVGVDMSTLGNVMIWAARCAAIMPGYEEVNGTGAKQFGAYFKSKLF